MAERVRAAIVVLADGDAAEAQRLVDLARLDPRDVLAAEEERRTGRRLGPVDTDRLQRRFGVERPVATGTASVVLLDAGACSPELLKAVRAVTRLGLADVQRLVQDPPATVARGLAPEEAEALCAVLRAAGGTAEPR